MNDDLTIDGTPLLALSLSALNRLRDVYRGLPGYERDAEKIERARSIKKRTNGQTNVRHFAK